MMEKALEHCRKHLGDNVTILHHAPPIKSIEKLVKDQGKEAGGPWDCHHAAGFYGWEAERVVAVDDGMSTMEMITRARTHLAVITVEDTLTKKYFQQAAEEGLVDVVHLQ